MEFVNLEQSGNTHSLNKRAEGDLKLIRSMMQRSSLFMPMPGWGIFAIGVIGSVTALLTQSMEDMDWIIAWGLAAITALVIAIFTSSWQMRKIGHSIFVGSPRRFWLSLAPAFIASGLLYIFGTRRNPFYRPTITSYIRFAHDDNRPAGIQAALG